MEMKEVARSEALEAEKNETIGLTTQYGSQRTRRCNLFALLVSVPVPILDLQPSSSNCSAVIVPSHVKRTSAKLNLPGPALLLKHCPNANSPSGKKSRGTESLSTQMTFCNLVQRRDNERTFFSRRNGVGRGLGRGGKDWYPI